MSSNRNSHVREENPAHSVPYLQPTFSTLTVVRACMGEWQIAARMVARNAVAVTGGESSPTAGWTRCVFEV